jgi:hypothetical protein
MMRARREHGAVLAELGILMPLLLVVILATVDFGRLIYTNQMIADLSRESAMLVSRGASSEQAFAATFAADDPLDVSNRGGIIISRVRRRSVDDPQPWIFTQDRAGILYDATSKVGVVGGPAEIPDVDELGLGITIMAVEIMHEFEPVFGHAGLGLDFYPDVIYDAAYF